MNIRFYSGLFLLLFLFSCEEKTVEIQLKSGDELFIGYWIDHDHTDSSQVLKRTASLANDSYAFALLSDGTFLENKNAGWCATPPISYRIYEGNWREKQKDTLLVNTSYWGGDMQIEMVIIKVSESYLEIKNEFISREEM